MRKTDTRWQLFVSAVTSVTYSRSISCPVFYQTQFARALSTEYRGLRSHPYYVNLFSSLAHAPFPFDNQNPQAAPPKVQSGPRVLLPARASLCLPQEDIVKVKLTFRTVDIAHSLLSNLKRLSSDREPKQGSFPPSPMGPSDVRQGYRMSLIGQVSAPHDLFSNDLYLFSSCQIVHVFPSTHSSTFRIPQLKTP